MENHDFVKTSIWMGCSSIFTDKVTLDSHWYTPDKRKTFSVEKCSSARIAYNAPALNLVASGGTFSRSVR